MLPLLVWITPRIGTFRYRGKEYELNDYYSQLLFGYFFALLFYELLFPNDIEKIARVL